MDKPIGMTQKAFNAWIDATFAAKIDPAIIVHTMDLPGSEVVASAGTHMPDGIIDGKRYTAAFDCSIHKLDDDKIKRLLSACYERHIIGWHRTRAEGFAADHLHMIFLGVPMKAILRSQVHDFFDERNGLRGHRHEDHAPITEATLQNCRATFLHYNPQSG